MKFSIVKYKNGGNIKTLYNFFLNFSNQIKVIEENDNFDQSDILILPGVGSFDPVINQLRNSNFTHRINEFISNKKKIVISICLGAQLLCHSSDESSGEKGLGLIKANVKKISGIKKRKPIIGPYNLQDSQESIHNLLFGNLDKNYYFYFMHSYQIILNEKTDMIANYQIENINILACFIKENIIGFQFHPELSGNSGIKLIKNTLKYYNF